MLSFSTVLALTPSLGRLFVSSTYPTTGASGSQVVGRMGPQSRATTLAPLKIHEPFDFKAEGMMHDDGLPFYSFLHEGASSTMKFMDAYY